MGGNISRHATSDKSFLTKNEVKAVAGERWSEEAYARLPKDARGLVDIEVLRIQLQDISNIDAEVPGIASHGVPTCPFARAPGVMTSPVPLVKNGNTYIPTRATSDLLKDIGGYDRLLGITTLHYERLFNDVVLEKFVEDKSEDHAGRFALWITEKMGGDKVWTRTLQFRPENSAYDRSSAHFRAWHSSRRPARDQGIHFKLPDCIIWMRIMFWAARDEGLADHPVFWAWYKDFIAHFVRVYETSAPPYATAAAEWSSNKANILEYEKNGYIMTDIITKYRMKL